MLHHWGGAINWEEVQEEAEANSITATETPSDMKKRKLGGTRREKYGLLEGAASINKAKKRRIFII